MHVLPTSRPHSSLWYIVHVGVLCQISLDGKKWVRTQMHPQVEKGLL